MKFVCPKCLGDLSPDGAGSLKCRLMHSYDRARQGYYNFLLSSAGGTHGDNKDMVEARRKFLDTGAYLPLAERISELAYSYHPEGGALLDVGCGEGYYTDIVARRFASGGKSAELYAFDISKEAVRLAARRNKSISLAVASAYRMPIADESFDTVTNLFSPLARDEIWRVLKRGGFFIMAIPAENHLFGLKSAIYDTPYKNVVEDSALDGFSLVESEKLVYKISLSSPEEIKNLFMMTPYAYRTGRRERDRVLSLESIETEIEFIIFIYRKNN